MQFVCLWIKINIIRHLTWFSTVYLETTNNKSENLKNLFVRAPDSQNKCLKRTVFALILSLSRYFLNSKRKVSQNYISLK